MKRDKTSMFPYPGYLIEAGADEFKVNIIGQVTTKKREDVHPEAWKLVLKKKKHLPKK